MKVNIDLDMSKYKELGPAMPEVQRRALNKTAQYMIDQLQVNSPVDTGYLKGWFRYKETDTMVNIRSPAKYAIFQDQGTYSYGPLGRKPKTKDVGGIKPKKFVDKSVNATKGRLDQFVIQSIQEVLK